MLTNVHRRLRDRLSPTAVRERIEQKQHAISSHLEELLDKMGAWTSGLPSTFDQIRALGLRIHRELVGEIALEARILVPALRRTDAWGDARVQMLKAQHKQRRAELMMLLAALKRADSRSLVRDVRDFVAARDRDIAEAKRTNLGANALRDDVIGVDVNGG